MRTYCKTIGALAAASALVAGTASAELEYELSTGYTSEYIFRGVNLGQDLVEVGASVATEYNGVGLSAGAWYGSFSSTDIHGFAGDQDYDELDLTIAASYDFGGITGEVGYIWYHLPRFAGDDAQEVYFAASTEFAGFEASIAYFWDVETDNDGYTEGSLSKSVPLNDCLTLTGGGTLGYLVEKGKLGHLTVKVALDYEINDIATISPFVAHSWALSEAGAYTGSKNQLFAGAILSVGF